MSMDILAFLALYKSVGICILLLQFFIAPPYLRKLKKQTDQDLLEMKSEESLCVCGVGGPLTNANS